MPVSPRPKIIDVHTHFIPTYDAWFGRYLDANGIDSAINLWNGVMPPFPPAEAALGEWAGRADARMTFFHTPSFEGVAEPGFEQRESDNLNTALKLGAKGIKVWKNLGLWQGADRGRLLRCNDARLAWLWETAAELDLPVAIHVGDAPAFFEPMDDHNERRREIDEHPEWWYGDSSRFPALHEIHDDFEDLVRSHPRTTFIAVHFGTFLPMQRLHVLLSECPNLNVDTAARVSDMGRARDRDAVLRIFDDFPDRVLFGTDVVRSTWHMPPEDDADPYLTKYLDLHFRFFETEDELPLPLPEQGDWRIRGLGLSGEQLQLLYASNAQRLLGL